ncbi:MAG: DUF459 domain-containing protein [Methylobacterium mesophilicum]|nr:DUF459 domain-containing protein [Methylobacterium mesophilicum]
MQRAGKRKQTHTVLARFLLAASLVLTAAAPAFAQDGGGFGFLRRIFRPRERIIDDYGYDDYQPAPRRQAAPRPQAPVQRRAPKPAAPVEPPPPPIAEKAADARTVLVIGDFMGAGLAEGLDAVFAQDPKIRVVDATNGSSGFVRDDVVDWPRSVAAMVEKEKPVAVVAMLGSNDRQGMKVGDTREPSRSPTWTIAYEGRTQALAKAVEKTKVPLLWVGLPSFKNPKMSADVVAFNDIYSRAAGGAGAEFVDVWDGFSDDAGAFTATGPDVNGQPVRLRGNDGINLTRAGKRKLAFYLEKPLARILGVPVGASKAVAGTDGTAEILPASLPAQAAGPAAPLDRTPPMALGSTSSAGKESELLGGPSPSPIKPNTAAVARVPGRADDFGGAAQ